jgi:hypothetical protein
MKKRLLIASTLLSAFTFAQVGVNTTTPKTTFDINAKSENTHIAGLQAPRLTRLELTNKGNTLYGVDQKGALIYVSDVSSGDTVGQRTNIVSIGYYYFDGNLWQKVMNNSTTTALEPWYNVASNTPATSNTQNIYQMGNVGVGTNSPASKLHTVSGTPYEAFQMQDGSQGEGKMLSSNAYGQGTWIPNPLKPMVFGSLNYSNNLVESNKLIGHQITLPKGRWLLCIGQLIVTEVAATTNNNLWVRMTVSSSNTSISQNGFAFLLNSLLAGWLSPSIAGLGYSYMNGFIPINVTDSQVTLYTWFRECSSTTGTPPAAYVRDSSENYIFAIAAY